MTVVAMFSAVLVKHKTQDADSNNKTRFSVKQKLAYKPLLFKSCPTDTACNVPSFDKPLFNDPTSN